MLGRPMRRIHEVLSCALFGLALSSGCSGGSGATGPKNPDPTGPTTSVQPKEATELDKLMRTRMNTHYSKLIYLVFHAEDGPDFQAISDESVHMTTAIQSVLDLPPPTVVQSDQAKQVYVDYNHTLKQQNDRFVAATSRKDIGAMQTSLTKVGDTCSACHHFFRIDIKEPQ